MSRFGLFPDTPRRRNTSFALVVLFMLSFALYAQALSFDFIPGWDDAEYVLDNPLIRVLDSQNLKAIFQTEFAGNYAPLHILSYSLDYVFWGLSPRGYHLTNVILHSLNGCLLYLLLLRYTGLSAVAFLSSLLFIVHPVNVENVAWVSERKTLLAAFFFFAAILTYLKFREKDRWRWYNLAILFYLFALLAKASAVTLPLILLLTEYYFFPARRGKYARLLPFFVLSLVFTGLVLSAHTRAHALEAGTFSTGLIWGTVIPTMIPVFWKYIGIILWPLDLSGFYETTLYHSFLAPTVLTSLIAWAVVFLLVIWKGSPLVRFWFLWFWVSMLPVANLIPLPVYYADRYLYIPAVGFFVLATVTLLRISSHVAPSSGTSRDRQPSPRSWQRLFLQAIPVVSLAIACAFLSYDRLPVWRNERTFWEDTVKKSPGQYKPHFNLAVVYDRQGDLDAAEREYEAAIQIYPSQEALFNLSVVRARKKVGKSDS